MSDKTSTYENLFLNWDQARVSEDQIQNQLINQGYFSDQIPEILKLYKKHKLDERTRKGFILMGIGSVLGFISCICTVYEILPEIREIILYGLTSIGITIALWGGYYVFE